MPRFAALFAISLGLLVAPLAAQDNPLVGTWERTSLKDAAGKDVQPPAPAAFLIMSADGHYIQISVPASRPKVDKPVDQLSREELVARFNQVEARGGRYTVSGNRLTRRYDRTANPNQEGTEQTQLFRLEGDVLILSSADPKAKNEARFRRAK
jgi:hypothetical protein